MNENERAAELFKATLRFAAKELRDAADEWPDAYASSVSDWLNDRADKLIEEAAR